jgi:PIN domain nuclease of toxin-antitoxin system
MIANPSKIVVDTHPFIFWLLDPPALSRQTLAIFAESKARFLVPVMVLLEVKYLIEIGRIETAIADMISYVNTTTGWELAPFDETVLPKTLGLEDKRDPFDRIILATAMAENCPIITRDRG